MPFHFALLAFVEGIVLYASFWAGIYLRLEDNIAATRDDFGSFVPSAILFTTVALIALASMGLYRARQSVRFVEQVARLCTAFALIALVDAALYYAIPSVEISRRAQAIALLLAFVGVLIVRMAFYSFVGSERFKRSVLVYGHGEIAAMLARTYAGLGHRSFRIVGYLGVLGDEKNAGCAPVFRRQGSVLQLARERKIDEIVVALDNRRGQFPMQELLDCRLAGINVSEVSRFIERETGKIDLHALRPSWLIYGGGFRQGTLHRAIKRQFDVVASVLLLAFGLPLMVLASVAILVESRGRGGVLLRQKRVGLNGKVFSMLKLRSMVPNAESAGRPQWAKERDPRVTRVGAIIRRLRIDELPQVLNILKGEMSFVGPRPERPEFVQELSEQIPFYRERHCVKPGLTGWAQLGYPYGASVEDARQKLQYDLFYVKHHTAMLDFLILLETLEVVVWGKRRSVQLEIDPQAGNEQERRIA